MQTRGITWPVMGIAVLAFWLAAPGLAQAEIVHRYSFASDAKDSVGGKDGALTGAAAVAGGQLVLDGSAGTYLDLPIGDTIANLSSATFETWVTWDHEGSCLFCAHGEAA